MLAIFKVLMQVSLDQSVKSIHCIIIVSLLRFILIKILSLSLSLSLSLCYVDNVLITLY